MRTAVVSGGFDPLHRGHLELFRYAKAMADRLVVIVECDEYVAAKHPVLQPQEERVAIIDALKMVDLAVPNDQESGDTSGILSTLRPDVYVVGPDHVDTSLLPEFRVCLDLKIPIVACKHLPKSHSSSIIVRRIQR